MHVVFQSKERLTERTQGNKSSPHVGTESAFTACDSVRDGEITRAEEVGHHVVHWQVISFDSSPSCSGYLSLLGNQSSPRAKRDVACLHRTPSSIEPVRQVQ